MHDCRKLLWLAKKGGWGYRSKYHRAVMAGYRNCSRLMPFCADFPSFLPFFLFSLLFFLSSPLPLFFFPPLFLLGDCTNPPLFRETGPNSLPSPTTNFPTKWFIIIYGTPRGLKQAFFHKGSRPFTKPKHQTDLDTWRKKTGPPHQVQRHLDRNAQGKDRSDRRKPSSVDHGPLSKGYIRELVGTYGAYIKQSKKV